MPKTARFNFLFEQIAELMQWNFLALLVLLLTDQPLVGQNIDLNNVVAGDVIDNSTPIPDGAVINLNGGSIASGTVFSDADFPNGVTLNVNDGSIGLGVEIHNSIINIAGGQVALVASNLSEGVNNLDNTVTVTGGDVGGFFQLRGTSTLELVGGTVESFGTLSNASATVTGGSFTLVDNNGQLNISGGDFNTFRSFFTAAVNLSGTDFAIDGVPITGLAVGSPFEIVDRNVTLSGTLSDGATFSNFLDSTTPIGDLDFGPFASQAELEAVPGFAAAGPSGTTVTVTLVAPTVLGDFDADGDVDADDIDFYSGNIGLDASGSLGQLDLDGDGLVSLADHDTHIMTLVETSNGQTGAFIGDINLDGAVDVLDDAFSLVSSLGSQSGGYANGDLNADQLVNVLGDAFRLVSNLGRTNDP